MNTERWRILSDWHNAWLEAPTDERAELRTFFATDAPGAASGGRRLAASSAAVDGFLELRPWSSPRGIWRGTSPRSLKAPPWDRTGSWR